VTIVTGFLGSGKSTLVNNILRRSKESMKVAVIENEVGAVGVDGAILRSAAEEVVEVNDGCLCCTVRGDLLSAFAQLGNVDAVIVETTGLADVVPVVQTFLLENEVIIFSSTHFFVIMIIMKSYLDIL
jgi:G3E family GTPase